MSFSLKSTILSGDIVAKAAVNTALMGTIKKQEVSINQLPNHITLNFSSTVEK